MTLRLRLANLRGQDAYAHRADRHDCISSIEKMPAMALLMPCWWTSPHSSYRHYQERTKKIPALFQFAFVGTMGRLVSGYFYVVAHRKKRLPTTRR